MTGRVNGSAARLLVAALFAATGVVALASDAEARARAFPRDNRLLACVKSAVAQKRVKSEGNDVRYTCFGPAAQNWYASLNGGRMVDDGPRGYFHSRYHKWDGYCAKHLTNPNGAYNEYYVCEIELPRR
jgi:hypothetical protein